MTARRHFRPKVGLILGSGSARGWAHIGVIQALREAGLKPDIICGTSIGALVGAVHASGGLDELDTWVRELGLRDVVSFMDLTLSGGMLKGERLMGFFKRKFQDRDIEDLDTPFGAVATSLHNGAEIWLRSGSTLGAVRASIALPALFAPVRHNGQILVDGGLVNPVPVSLARAMGADILIAVDLNSDLLGRHLRRGPTPQAESESPPAQEDDWFSKLQNNLTALLPESSERDRNKPEEPEIPSVLDVVASSINIMQERITRSRMVGEPPHIVIAPRLAHLGLMDFHRATEAIEEGRRAAKECIPAIKAFDIDLS
ncbi:patatin [Pusillimonas sp. T2]|uniref:patatin-like phospholipase RssA n=1 Tax=Pusillimonas sp. T2 TaxID=1548123 RepID=UPI000B9CF50B|nr:patatin-like phospholipase RssA [Pusillimonas sp. T2]OXR48325.1 patatin [Pusillimonas sp. T2]